MDLAGLNSMLLYYLPALHYQIIFTTHSRCCIYCYYSRLAPICQALFSNFPKFFINSFA